MKSDLNVVRTAMQVISAGAGDYVIDAPVQDRKLLVGKQVWLMSDRDRIQRALDAVCVGALDAVGLPRFSLPAEYVAGAIAVCVHPVNYQVACHVAADRIPSRPVEQESSEDEPVFGALSARQLFALVLQAAADAPAFRAAWIKRVDKSLEAVANA